MKSESEHLKLNENKWDRWAKTFDDRGWKKEYLRKAQRSLVSVMNIKENMRFLDVGCGTGRALGYIAGQLKGKGSFYGADLSSKMIDKAKDNFKDCENFHFVRANAESIPLDDDFFDVIICTNSFHHYFNPVNALREMRRLLKPGGKLFILDPTADTRLIRLFSKFAKAIEPDHVKLYSTSEFQGMYKAAGLKYTGTQIINFHQKVHIGEK